MLKFRHYTDADFPGLNEFLVSANNSMFYSNPRYISLLQEHLEAKAGWFVAYDGNEILGAIPYLLKNGPLGAVYNSLAYYGSNGGVLYKHENLDVTKNLLDFFFDNCIESQACSATVITNPLDPLAPTYRDLIVFDHLDSRVGQITDLSNAMDEDELLASFSDPRPRNIRRAQRAGITVQKSQDKATLQFLFNTHKSNIESIGGLAKSWDFFNRIPDWFPHDDWMQYTAYLNGEPISSLLLFYHKDVVEYYTPATVVEHRNLQPLSLVIYTAMLDAIKSGAKFWNWGGTWLTQTGVYDYKKKWNAYDFPYQYFTRVFNPSVKGASAQELLSLYRGFYVLPFNALNCLNETRP